jgi:hypothetical protein
MQPESTTTTEQDRFTMTVCPRCCDHLCKMIENEWEVELRCQVCGYHELGIKWSLAIRPAA